MEFSVTDPISLGDLRWLVQQCDASELLDDCTVEVQGRKEYNQMDWDPAVITVHGKPK